MNEDDDEQESELEGELEDNGQQNTSPSGGGIKYLTALRILEQLSFNSEGLVPLGDVALRSSSVFVGLDFRVLMDSKSCTRVKTVRKAFTLFCGAVAWKYLRRFKDPETGSWIEETKEERMEVLTAATNQMTLVLFQQGVRHVDPAGIAKTLGASVNKKSGNELVKQQQDLKPPGGKKKSSSKPLGAKGNKKSSAAAAGGKNTSAAAADGKAAAADGSSSDDDNSDKDDDQEGDV